MNEQLLNKVADWIIKTTEQIGDFAAKEIPPFIGEYLTWKFWEASCNVFFWSIPVLITLIIAIKLYKPAKKLTIEELDNSAGTIMFLTVLPYAAWVFAICASFPYTSIKDMIQIKVAPKVYLVEKAAEIYKQNK